MLPLRSTLFLAHVLLGADAACTLLHADREMTDWTTPGSSASTSWLIFYWRTAPPQLESFQGPPADVTDEEQAMIASTWTGGNTIYDDVAYLNTIAIVGREAARDATNCYHQSDGSTLVQCRASDDSAVASHNRGGVSRWRIYCGCQKINTRHQVITSSSEYGTSPNDPNAGTYSAIYSCEKIPSPPSWPPISPPISLPSSSGTLSSLDVLEKAACLNGKCDQALVEVPVAHDGRGCRLTKRGGHVRMSCEPHPPSTT